MEWVCLNFMSQEKSNILKKKSTQLNWTICNESVREEQFHYLTYHYGHLITFVLYNYSVFWTSYSAAVTYNMR